MASVVHVVIPVLALVIICVGMTLLFLSTRRMRRASEGTLEAAKGLQRAAEQYAETLSEHAGKMWDAVHGEYVIQEEPNGSADRGGAQARAADRKPSA